jgi:hypothetical protein
MSISTEKSVWASGAAYEPYVGVGSWLASLWPGSVFHRLLIGWTWDAVRGRLLKPFCVRQIHPRYLALKQESSAILRITKPVFCRTWAAQLGRRLRL